MHQRRLENWLGRVTSDRGIHQCIDNAVVLSSDIGLVRTENQDRAAALRFVAGDEDFIAVAVVDGMGGMRDGGRCATLAISAFFQGLIESTATSCEQRAIDAARGANNAVFQFVEGHGGSTLSALVITHSSKPVVLNVGDSRVYGIAADAITRLTVDDSLKEAVGGYGRELLQFIGMGEGMQPHTKTLESVDRIAITTDGIHYVNAEVFERVLANAGNLRSASERSTALAKWCGGPDNATSAMVDLVSLRTNRRHGKEADIEVWDPWGTLTIASGLQGKKIETPQQHRPDLIAERNHPNQTRSDNHHSNNSPRKAVTKKGQPKRKREPKSTVQFEIEIGSNAEPNNANENSK